MNLWRIGRDDAGTGGGTFDPLRIGFESIRAVEDAGSGSTARVVAMFDRRVLAEVPEPRRYGRYKALERSERSSGAAVVVRRDGEGDR